MYIMDTNQYAIELVTYLLVLVVYFYELIVYMLLERNAFDTIAFFSQCILTIVLVRVKSFFVIITAIRREIYKVAKK